MEKDKVHVVEATVLTVRYCGECLWISVRMQGEARGATTVRVGELAVSDPLQPIRFGAPIQYGIGGCLTFSSAGLKKLFGSSM